MQRKNYGDTIYESAAVAIRGEAELHPGKSPVPALVEISEPARAGAGESPNLAGQGNFFVETPAGLPHSGNP